MAGSGGGKGGGNANNDTLANLSKSLFDETDPIRKDLLSQGEQGLSTGGVGALLPVISRAVESSKDALSNTLQDTQARLGTTGLAKSPYGQAILANTEREGNARTADIGPNMTMSFLSMLPSFITGASGQALQGQAAAAQNTQSGINTNTQAFADILSAAMPKTSLSYAGGK